MKLTMSKEAFDDQGLDIGHEITLERGAMKPARYCIDAVYRGDDDVELELSPA